MQKEFIKDHILVVSIPKYDWNKIAEDKKNNKAELVKEE